MITMIISKIKGTIWFRDFKFIKGRMTAEEGHGWSMRKSHLHLQHWEHSAVEASKLLWRVLRGLRSSFIRLSPSWDGTRLLIQFSSTKPCWLLWGVSPPPFWFPLFSPSSLRLWPFPAQAQVISVTLSQLFQQRDPKEMGKKVVTALFSSWDLLSVWAAVSRTLLSSQAEDVQGLSSCQMANRDN